MLKWKNKEHLGVLLNKYPTVAYFIKHKATSIKKEIEELQLKYSDLDLTEDELKTIEKIFVDSLEDWLIYVKDPDAYDRLSFNKWDDKEILNMTDYDGKIVIDIGAGTGSQTFRLANHARYIYAVEPIANLRKYIKTKAKKLNHNNIYVVDGLITQIPFPDNFADVVLGGHVFGDDFEEEYNEIERVVRPNGLILLIPGNTDSDNLTHEYLIKKGFMFSKFYEPGPDTGKGWKRKYWKYK
jgi:SAM-dependent methyltransferase